MKRINVFSTPLSLRLDAQPTTTYYVLQTVCRWLLMSVHVYPGIYTIQHSPLSSIPKDEKLYMSGMKSEDRLNTM